MTTQNMFTSRGAEAKASAEKETKVDLKEVYIRLKANEEVAVRLLSAEDYVEYLAHASYNHGVYTQPCTKVLGQECPMCVASKSGVDGYDALNPKKRYIFVFAEIETGKLRALDVSKNQAKKLISDIESYREDINDFSFKLKKTGEAMTTAFALTLVTRLDAKMKEKFEDCAELEVTNEFLNSVLVPKSAEFQAKVLKDAGFPVEVHMPHIKPFEKDGDKNDGNVADTGTKATGQAGASAQDVLDNM